MITSCLDSKCIHQKNDNEGKGFKPSPLELQVSHRFCSKIQMQADIRNCIAGRWGKLLRKQCEYKGIQIAEANACVNHIHMRIKIPPKVWRGADNGGEREELSDDIRELSASVP